MARPSSLRLSVELTLVCIASQIRSFHTVHSAHRERRLRRASINTVSGACGGLVIRVDSF